MDTIIEKVDSHITGNEPNAALDAATEILKKGGLVAIPTETVYGLAGDALNPDAARKIYEAKGRPSDNPLIVHIANEEDLKKIAKDIPEAAYKLMDVFWPGPMTMIFNKTELVPSTTTGGLETVAVRMPSHHVAYELIRRSGIMLAAPSANTKSDRCRTCKGGSGWQDRYDPGWRCLSLWNRVNDYRYDK